MQAPVDGSHTPLQQSLSNEQVSPDRRPDGPPQVSSHVPQSPSQHSASLPQVSPNCAPENPPQVPSHVPQTPPQQSLSTPQKSPSTPPDAPPHVPSHVPQVTPLQQSESCPHVSPCCEHGLPQVLLPGSHVSTPQQSLSLPQPSPLEAHPQVPSTHRAEQHSAAEPHGTPSSEQPPEPPPSSPDAPAPQVLLVPSHRYAPQQSVESLAGSQSPPMPAHAGWHVPLAQFSEQQSPLVLQQSSSSWQNGSDVAHAPPSVPPSESFPPLPLPLPPSFLPPLLLPLPLPPSAELPTHLPAVHDSEQQSPNAEQGCPPCLHLDVPHFPAPQSLLQQSVLVAHALPSG